MSSGNARRATPSSVPAGRDARGRDACAEHSRVREIRVDVGRVEVQPDDVGEGHPALAQHGLEIVGGQRDLGRHVARMLRRAVGVDRGLPGAEQHLARARHELPLVEPEVHRPCPRVDGDALDHDGSLHRGSPDPTLRRDRT